MNIIVVFPKIEHAKNVRSILQRSGYTVGAACTSGAQALRAASGMDGGIMICTYRLPDMLYRELYEYLAPRYEMLCIGSEAQIEECAAQQIVGLCTPLKVHELLQTVGMMAQVSARKKKQLRQKPRSRSQEEQRLIGQAKRLLMERNHFPEEEAHRYLQKRSMENGTSLTETAQMILSMMGDNG